MIEIKLTRCQVAALVVIGAVIGIPSALIALAMVGKTVYAIVRTLGFEDTLAGAIALFSCVGLGVMALISIVFRNCEGRWFWEAEQPTPKRR